MRSWAQAPAQAQAHPAATPARQRAAPSAALPARLRALLWAPLRRGWRRATQALDAKPERERAALGALALAVLVALELLWVLPMRAQRQAVFTAVEAQDEAEQAAALTRQDEQTRALGALEARRMQLVQELRAYGIGATQGESLAQWLQRALADQSVALLSLRDLGTQEVEAAVAAPDVHAAAVEADAAATAAAPAADGAAPAPALNATATATASVSASASASATLYRHRYELTLGGEPAALTAAVQALGDRLRPLQLARVRLASPDGVAVQATLAFVVVTPQRVWISL